MKKLFVLALLMAFCAAASFTPLTGATKVTIMLDWVPNTNHTGLFVAQSKGYFKQAGLEVVILEQSQGLPVEQLVSTGKVDFGISSQEWATFAMAEGLPIVSVAAVVQHNTTAYVSLKKEGLKKPSDFEGRTFASWGLPLEKAMIGDVVISDGGDPSKMKELVIGTADLLAMLGRDVDIAWIFMGWQGIEAKLRGMELSAIQLRDIPSIPDYYTPIIVSSRKFIEEHEDTAKAFMAAVSKGYTFAAMSPAEAASILMAASPEMNRQLAIESQAYLSPRYIEDAAYWGLQKQSTWKALYDWMVGHDLVKPGLDSLKFFSNELLK